MEEALRRIKSKGFRRHSVDGSGIRTRMADSARKSRSVKVQESTIASNYLRGVAQGSVVRDTFRMISEHNRKIRATKEARRVTWADKEIGTSRHVPLPRRYGPSVYWSSV